MLDALKAYRRRSSLKLLLLSIAELNPRIFLAAVVCDLVKAPDMMMVRLMSRQSMAWIRPLLLGIGESMRRKEVNVQRGCDDNHGGVTGCCRRSWMIRLSKSARTLIQDFRTNKLSPFSGSYRSITLAPSLAIWLGTSLSC